MLTRLKERIEEVARSLAANYRGDAGLRGRVEVLEAEVKRLKAELERRVETL